MRDPKTDPVDVSEVVERLEAWLLCDSAIRLTHADRLALTRAVTDDARGRASLPTARDCEELVCGDENGEITRVARWWPLTSEAVGALLYALLY